MFKSIHVNNDNFGPLLPLSRIFHDQCEELLSNPKEDNILELLIFTENPFSIPRQEYDFKTMLLIYFHVSCYVVQILTLESFMLL